MVDSPLLRPWRSGPCAANLAAANLAAQPAPHDPGTAWPSLVTGARETQRLMELRGETILCNETMN